MVLVFYNKSLRNKNSFGSIGYIRQFKWVCKVPATTRFQQLDNSRGEGLK